MTKILVVEDDAEMSRMIAAFLGHEGFEFVAAYDGSAALTRCRDEAPDLVVLDLDLPLVSGEEVCQRIRSRSDIPILVLSGTKDEERRAQLLEGGADDYLVKPFSRRELSARLRALLRRARAGRGEERSRVGTLVVDPAQHSVTLRGERLPFTLTEFRLLATLVARADAVASHAELLAAGWPRSSKSDAALLTPHVTRMRAKLAARGGPYIENVRGVGYRLLATDIAA